MIPKFGLFTPYTLRFYSEYYNESSSNFLKRCFVLFDELTFIEPRNQDKGFIKELIFNELPDKAHDLLSYFIPVKELVSEDLMTDISYSVQPESNMCYGPNREIYIDFIKKFLTSKFGFDAYNIKNGQEFEILDYYVTALSVDFNFLFQLSKENKEISALYTELHRDAYSATYDNKTIVPERVLQKVCSLNLFDFGNLSWEQILELKRSRFITDFRQKFTEWLQEYNITESESDFEKKIDKYIKTSNFEFLKKNRPQLITNVATGILGNIPTPFPNPISIYTSAQQIIKDYNKKNEFGWLFFIQEAFNKSLQN